ncbi:MAG: S8 family serine peptidase [Acidobacteria bacterium]|nr:S8 family serine peptidase [Acidobacteriota bacterium]
MKVPEAWKRFAAGREPGEGGVVGHPDTGYTRHPEITSRLLTDKGFDFVNNDSDARDELKRGFLLFPGHGTGTSSVIVSPQGAQTNFGNLGANPLAVWGVAPGAKLIPVRVSTSVVLVGGGVLNLARAIEHAADKNVHVISISMGTGFPNSRLLKAVQYAQKRGVIVLAAAGNYVGFVVWPAAYDEVIAVAASNARNKTWLHSSRGGAVDVTAPGESVWCAGVEDNGGFSVGRGSGTSFAVATVAGVAALWLSHHGRAKLAKRYGAEKIPVIFNQILRDNCDPLAGAGPGFGRGLVNADRVLAAPLPDGVRALVPTPAFALRELPAIDAGGLATFRHLFESPAAQPRRTRAAAAATVSDAVLRARLAELLGVTEEELPARLREVGQELAFHLASDPDLYNAFAATLAPKRPRAAEKKAAPKRVATRAAVTTAPAGVESVRGALLTKDTSAALKAKVSGVG